MCGDKIWFAIFDNVECHPWLYCCCCCSNAVSPTDICPLCWSRKQDSNLPHLYHRYTQISRSSTAHLPCSRATLINAHTARRAARIDIHRQFELLRASTCRVPTGILPPWSAWYVWRHACLRKTKKFGVTTNHTNVPVKFTKINIATRIVLLELHGVEPE